MPRYRIQAEVPAGTAESQAVTASIEVEERFVDRALLFVPPGSAGLVQAELLFGEARLVPTAGSDRTVLPGTTDPAPVRRTFRGSPTDLTLRAFAPNSSFPHTVTARIDALDPAQVTQDVQVAGFDESPVSATQPDSVQAQDLQADGDDE